MATATKPKRSTTKSSTKPKRRKRKPIVVEDTILYPEISVEYCFGDDALTEGKAKELLGWQECKKDPLLVDLEGNKIRCCHNMSNRPFQMKLCLQYVQEILRKKWRSNCQNRIIGKTGLVISGQHALIALVLANQKWLDDRHQYPLWKTKPTMETLIAFGCDEDEETVDTVDTGKPRTLTDVLFRSAVFEGETTNKRKALSTKLDSAIRTLWDRTGVPNAFSLQQTHSESRNFLNQHPKIVDCVKHIFEEDNKNSITNIIPAGAASALLFMMGCSESDADKYHDLDLEQRSDKVLDWSRWDDACNLFTYLSQRTKELEGLVDAYGNLCSNLAKTNDAPSVKARIGLVALAWQEFVDNGSVPSSLELDYEIIEEGSAILTQHPTVGGIDRGKDTDPVYVDPTPTEIKERETEERTKAKKKTNPSKSSPKRKPKKRLTVGKQVKVTDPDGTAWEGELVEMYNEFAVVEDVEGESHEVEVTALTPV